MFGYPTLHIGIKKTPILVVGPSRGACWIGPERYQQNPCTRWKWWVEIPAGPSVTRSAVAIYQGSDGWGNFMSYYEPFQAEQISSWNVWMLSAEPVWPRSMELNISSICGTSEYFMDFFKDWILGPGQLVEEVCCRQQDISEEERNFSGMDIALTRISCLCANKLLSA